MQHFQERFYQLDQNKRSQYALKACIENGRYELITAECLTRQVRTIDARLEQDEPSMNLKKRRRLSKMEAYAGKLYDPFDVSQAVVHNNQWVNENHASYFSRVHVHDGETCGPRMDSDCGTKNARMSSYHLFAQEIIKKYINDKERVVFYLKCDSVHLVPIFQTTPTMSAELEVFVKDGKQRLDVAIFDGANPNPNPIIFNVEVLHTSRTDAGKRKGRWCEVVASHVIAQEKNWRRGDALKIVCEPREDIRVHCHFLRRGTSQWICRDCVDLSASALICKTWEGVLLRRRQKKDAAEKQEELSRQEERRRDKLAGDEAALAHLEDATAPWPLEAWLALLRRRQFENAAARIIWRKWRALLRRRQFENAAARIICRKWRALLHRRQSENAAAEAEQLWRQEQLRREKVRTQEEELRKERIELQIAIEREVEAFVPEYNELKRHGIDLHTCHTFFLKYEGVRVHRTVRLNCPYSQRDEAKSLGASWDGISWRVDAGVNLIPFSEWIDSPLHIGSRRSLCRVWDGLARFAATSPLHVSHKFVASWMLKEIQNGSHNIRGTPLNLKWKACSTTPCRFCHRDGKYGVLGPSQ